MAITGGCLCGNVRYEIEGDARFGGHCYCSDCRKVSGTGHGSVIGVAKSALKLSGGLCDYTVVGDSGRALTRSFCPTCGTGIMALGDGGNMVAIKAGTLDDPEVFEPQMAVYVSSAPSWDQPPEGLHRFEKMPPRA